jgi:hypothetical protein
MDRRLEVTRGAATWSGPVGAVGPRDEFWTTRSRAPGNGWVGCGDTGGSGDSVDQEEGAAGQRRARRQRGLEGQGEGVAAVRGRPATLRMRRAGWRWYWGYGCCWSCAPPRAQLQQHHRGGAPAAAATGRRRLSNRRTSGESRPDDKSGRPVRTTSQDDQSETPQPQRGGYTRRLRGGARAAYGPPARRRAPPPIARRATAGSCKRRARGSCKRRRAPPPIAASCKRPGQPAWARPVWGPRRRFGTGRRVRGLTRSRSAPGERRAGPRCRSLSIDGCHVPASRVDQTCNKRCSNGCDGVACTVDSVI